MPVAYLGLGSNLGDRRGFIAAALVRLAAAGVAIEAQSPLYETDAVTPDAQPPYLNAAARIATTLSAHAFLDLCLAVEHTLGRARPSGRAQAPRQIDLDLLLYGDGADAIVDEGSGLIVPHPRLLLRPFVRIPLADVALPGLVHPTTRERLDRADADPAVRVFR